MTDTVAPHRLWRTLVTVFMTCCDDWTPRQIQSYTTKPRNYWISDETSKSHTKGKSSGHLGRSITTKKKSSIHIHNPNWQRNNNNDRSKMVQMEGRWMDGRTRTDTERRWVACARLKMYFGLNGNLTQKDGVIITTCDSFNAMLEMDGMEQTKSRMLYIMQSRA